MDSRWPKLFTVGTLVFGMFVALGARTAGFKVGNLIIFAQAITILGNPLLAGCMLWLATREDLTRRQAVPLWMKALAAAGFTVVLVLSIRTGYRLYLQLAT